MQSAGALIEVSTGYKLILGSQDSAPDTLQWDPADYPCNRCVPLFALASVFKVASLFLIHWLCSRSSASALLCVAASNTCANCMHESHR